MIEWDECSATGEEIVPGSIDDCTMWFGNRGHLISHQPSINNFYSAGINVGPAFLMIAECETLEEAKEACEKHLKERPEDCVDADQC
jgi:hypothetical protein